MNSIHFDYPTSYLLLCAGIAIVFALVLYFRDQRWADKSQILPFILGTLRGLVVFILSVLLLSPFLTYFEEKTEEPVVILAIDNSESMRTGPDTLLPQLRQLPSKLREELKSFEHVQITFGEEVNPLDSLDFNESKTDISSVFDFVKNDLQGRNIAGIVLVSDGMYNLGQNPQYAISDLNAPIFPIAMGDTSTKKDISLVDLFHNEIAYRGDHFLVEADVKAEACQGSETTISLYAFEDGKPKRVGQKQVSIDQTSYFNTFEFKTKAEVAGVQKFMVTVSGVDGESTIENNSKIFYIDVIDGRQKVLLVGGAPHPDLTAMKQSLTANENYEVDVILPKDELPELKEYDVLILHQTPFKKSKPAYLDAVLNSDLPKLFVTGLDTDFKQLNQLNTGLDVNIKRGSANTVSPRPNPNFNAFSFSEENANRLANYPPLETPFADFNISAGGQTMFYQNIGNVSTQFPLITLGRTNREARTAFILGEGFWRWRLYEFDRSGAKGPADQLLGQIIQYLSVTDDKRRFISETGKSLYDENEPIQFRAEFYNKNYELINSPDVFIELRSSEGDSYRYTMSKKDDFYTLNAGFLPIGDYSYSATLTWNGEDFNHTGKFAIKEIQLELYRTTADHNLLRLLANESGGSVMEFNELTIDLQKIRESDTAQAILYSQPTTRALINLPIIFALIMILLTIEWFTRRWVGSY